MSRSDLFILLALSVLVIHPPLPISAQQIVIAETEWANCNMAPAVESLSTRLQGAFPGSTVAVFSASDLAGLSPADVDLLVLPDSAAIPLNAGVAVQDYLEAGGNMLTFGGILFQEVLVRHNAGWITVPEALKQGADSEPLFSLHDSEGGPDAWQHGSHLPGPGHRPVIVDAPEGRALRFEMDFTPDKIWESWALALEEPVPEGHAVTSFWIRGDAGTEAMQVEWRERDGSRWIATVPVTPRWERVSLLERDFLYWHDNNSSGRGGQADQLNLGNVYELSLGLAKSHGPVADGRRRFSITPVETAPLPFDGESLERLREPLECYRPEYKQFTLKSPAASRDWQPARESGWADWPNAPGIVYCAIPRTRGTALDGEETYRWHPLREARSGEGGIGTFIWRLVHHNPDGPFRHGVWTNVGVRLEEALQLDLGSVLPLACPPAVLIRAGGRQHSYFADENIEFGAALKVLRPLGEDLLLHQRLTDPNGNLVVDGAETKPGRRNFVERVQSPSFTLEPGNLPPGTYIHEVELRTATSTLLDRQVSTFTIVEERADPPEAFVAVKDGAFHVDGAPWFPHGINFWPRYVSGLDPTRYQLHWLRPASYDAAYVERDLDIAESLGLNMVSVQYMEADHAPALADFLERCRRHGIRANIYVDGMHPVEAADSIRWAELIRAARLTQNADVFAWDIAWEPHLGFADRRARWTLAWNDWLAEQYGSPRAAEDDWHWILPCNDNGLVEGPTDEQLAEDGEWRVMVAAYRRFADDFISRAYNKRCRAARALAPHTLLGVRTGWGGTGTEWAQRGFQYDLASGARHLDFLSPEAWGYNPDNMWEAGIITAYGRLVSGGKPVFWSEFGLSITLQPTPDLIKDQGRTYDALFRMMEDSGAQGSAGWWWPGGYRVAENSDYGILNPDGTPRPAALVLREQAESWRSRGAAPEPSGWFEVDRDADARGMYGIRLQAQNVWRAALDGGLPVALRTPGTGTTSADCPLVAVGHSPARAVPCDGTNPPKYLNAELDKVQWRDPASGVWQDLAEGERIKPGDQPLRLRFQWGNTGEARWLPPGAAGDVGGVFLAARRGDEVLGRWPLLRATPFLGTATFQDVEVPASHGETLTFRLEAEGRAPFGETVTLRMGP